MTSSNMNALHMPSCISDALKSFDTMLSKATPSLSALKALTVDKRVEQAFSALNDDILRSEFQSASHGPIVCLLNCISSAYHQHVVGPDSGDAIIFTSTPSGHPLGDYLGLGTTPDVYAFAGKLDTLRVACNAANYQSRQAWSTILEVGEISRPIKTNRNQSQLKSNITGVKRYRPDLPVVHAFSLSTVTMRLATVNACGMIESPEVPATSVWPWIAHVLQVYTSYEVRDRTIQHCPGQEGFYRWDIRVGGEAIAVTPFYVGHAPGRTTFACFEVARLPADAAAASEPPFLAELDRTFGSGVVRGFWKLSWQRTTPRSSERELLDYAHRDGWIPGLVRHHPATSVRDAFDEAYYHPSGSQPRGRVKDILHLGSIGQPLSQCETAGDLLDAMYDLIVTHLHLFQVGVLHRDVSWCNVLCKPRHDLKIHPTFNRDQILESPYPCIGRILGVPNAEPCILLADLDHALKLSESDILVGPDGRLVEENNRPDVEDPKAERTGTPMFMALELLDSNAVFFGKQCLNDLWDAFRTAERHRVSFGHAFPQGDGKFLGKFKAVMKAERKRKLKMTNDQHVSVKRHGLRHDAESMYWDFLWAFSRARPIDADPDEIAPSTFDQFCTGMLRHLTGRQPDGTERATWLISNKVANLFHPLLIQFESLFMQMATYLSIPWHLYPDMPEDHVQSAFRRLILAFRFDRNNAPSLKVRLDTAAPRFTRAFDNARKLRMYNLTTEKRAETCASATIASAGVTTRAQKRKAEEEAGDGPPKKRALSSALATAGDDASDATSSVAGDFAQKTTIDAELRLAASGDRGPDELEPAGEVTDDGFDESDGTEDNDFDHSVDAEGGAPASQSDVADTQPGYIESEHRDSHSVQALRLMFWKDRSLWFGAGK